jgi:hypothetical protein
MKGRVSSTISFENTDMNDSSSSSITALHKRPFQSTPLATPDVAPSPSNLSPHMNLQRIQPRQAMLSLVEDTNGGSMSTRQKSVSQLPSYSRILPASINPSHLSTIQASSANTRLKPAKKAVSYSEEQWNNRWLSSPHPPLNEISILSER